MPAFALVAKLEVVAEAAVAPEGKRQCQVEVEYGLAQRVPDAHRDCLGSVYCADLCVWEAVTVSAGTQLTEVSAETRTARHSYWRWTHSQADSM